MAKIRSFGGAKGVLGCSFIVTYYSHLNSYNKIVSNYQTGKACFQLFSIRLICSVIIIPLQIKGTLNTPTLDHSDKTIRSL